MKTCFFLSLPLFLFSSHIDLDFPHIETHHTYNAEQTALPYQAITGILPIEGQRNTHLADLGFIAYLADGQQNRPITFVFPGGPGGACGLEAICTIGPRRLSLPLEGKQLLPPYQMIDNPESLLPWTDLVFVDPVDTGYSEFSENATDEEKKWYFSTDGDIACLGDFIRTFIAYFDRWNSPKYLFGASYGTVRCCGLSEYLLQYDLSLHGMILLGSAMDYSILISQHNRPLPDSLLIPTFAATAWYHKRFWPESSLSEVIDYARRFCYDEYIPFMLQPTRIGEYEQSAFYAKLAELIGLELDVVQRYRGRFDENLYTGEFFAKERKILGGCDTRYSGDLSSIVRDSSEEDPSYRDMQGCWCAFNAYLSQELQTPRPNATYVSYSRSYWDFSTYDSLDWPDLFQRLRRTLIYNPSMKIFSGSGYYDCRTPFAGTEFCFDHMDLPLSYRKNIQFEYYEAGHGFVFDGPSLKKLKKDLVKFYEHTISP